MDWIHALPEIHHLQTIKDADDLIRSLVIEKRKKNPRLYYGTKSGKIYCYRKDSEQFEFKYSLIGHKDSITSLLINTTGHYLISSSKDGTIFIWDIVERRNHIILTGSGKKIYITALSHDEKYLLSGGEDGYLTIWSINQNENGVWNSVEIQGKLLGPSTTIHSIIFDHLGGNCFAAGDCPTIFRWIWNPMLKFESITSELLNGHDKRIFRLIQNPINENILSLGEDKTIRIWNSKKMNSIKEVILPKACVNLIFYPRKNQAISLTVNNHLNIFNISDWTLLDDIGINQGEMGILEGNDNNNLLILSSFNVENHPIWIWTLK